MARKWYIAQTYSGYETSVKVDLEQRIKSLEMEDKIHSILVPEEEYEEITKAGKKVIKKRKMYPGYIFVEMEVDQEVDEKAWFMIRNTPKVTGFLGSSGGGTKPIALRDEEINNILKKLGHLEKPVIDFNVGDKVQVTTGPWSGQVGEIHAINEEKETVTVFIEIFGRRAPSEFDFVDVKIV